MMSLNNIWKYVSKLFNYPIVGIRHYYSELGGYEWTTKYPEYGIILGGMPRENFFDENKEIITGIINLCDEKICSFPIEILHLPTIDLYEPSLEYMWKAVRFIERKVILNNELKPNKYVYVHCRTGIGRSATICIAWLCYKFKMNPHDALIKLKDKRVQINDNCAIRSNIIEFYHSIKNIDHIEKFENLKI